jgi:hypothetical protein
MSKRSKKNLPYLIDSRLGDVIGVIQVLGSTQWHAIMPEHWYRYFGKAHSDPTGEWKPVFEEHPEFFQIEKNGDVALRWRFAYPRTYDPRKNIDYTPEQRDLELTPEERDKLHRRPLSAEQISALMNIAIELHARQVAQQQESRWLVPILASFTGGLLGALLGFAGAILAARIKGTP